MVDEAALAELERRREELWLVFEHNGGRGIELAEEIDELDRQIAEAKGEPHELDEYLDNWNETL